ncbi:MAG TPA: hypothetical protein VK808_03120 [Bacteroidia bacterium]|jgi:hypothetical protein|nr:hypothetical protein [Bacteroidia bacterium]
MKSNSNNYFDPDLERLMEEIFNDTNKEAEKDGAETGTKGLPALYGDILEPYIGKITATYDELGARIQQKLLPEKHPINAMMKLERAKEKSQEINTEVEKRDNQNNTDKDNMENFHPNNLISRVCTALLTTGIILVGEILFNSKAFQFFGETLLFSLGISFSISFSTYLFSHMVPLFYKEATTRLKRWLVILISLIIALAVFVTLGILRATMFSQQGISISPSSFVIINMFFFIVSCVCSYYLLPSWAEIQEHRKFMVKYREIKKRDKEIDKFKQAHSDLKDNAMGESMIHSDAVIYAKKLDARVNKMCQKSINTFINANLRNRKDKKTPECFINYFKNGGNSITPPNTPSLN